MPHLETKAQDQLLLHQFLATLSAVVSISWEKYNRKGQKPPNSIGIDLTVDGHGQPRSGCGCGKWPNPMEQCTEQAAQLTEQVVAPSTKSHITKGGRGLAVSCTTDWAHAMWVSKQLSLDGNCFICSKWHLANECHYIGKQPWGICEAVAAGTSSANKT